MGTTKGGVKTKKGVKEGGKKEKEETSKVESERGRPTLKKGAAPPASAASPDKKVEQKKVLKKATTTVVTSSSSQSHRSSLPTTQHVRAQSASPLGRGRDSPSRNGSGSRTRRLLGSLRRSAREVSDAVGRVSPALKELELPSFDVDKLRDRVKEKDAEKDAEKKKKKDEKEKEKEKEEQLSPDSEKEKLERMYLDRSRKTDVKEVWFAGVHCGEFCFVCCVFSRLSVWIIIIILSFSVFLSLSLCVRFVWVVVFNYLPDTFERESRRFSYFFVFTSRRAAHKRRLTPTPPPLHP